MTFETFRVLVSKSEKPNVDLHQRDADDTGRELVTSCLFFYRKAKMVPWSYAAEFKDAKGYSLQERFNYKRTQKHLGKSSCKKFPV
jgi:hypothetical protein